MAKLEDSLTTQQVAEKLNVDQSTVRRMLASGKIKGIKKGAVWLVEPKELGKMVDRIIDNLKESKIDEH